MVSTKKYHSPQISSQKCLLFFVNMPRSHIWRCPDRLGVMDICFTMPRSVDNGQQENPWSGGWLKDPVGLSSILPYQQGAVLVGEKWETHGDTIFFVWWYYCYIIYSNYTYLFIVLLLLNGMWVSSFSPWMSSLPAPDFPILFSCPDGSKLWGFFWGVLRSHDVGSESEASEDSDADPLARRNGVGCWGHGVPTVPTHISWEIRSYIYNYGNIW